MVVLAVAASLGLGLLTNFSRLVPLPLRYENREARMLRAVGPEKNPAIREPAAVDFQSALHAWKSSGAVFVDAREPAFFEEGHVPGAVNLPQEQIGEANAIEKIADKSRPLVVYCTGEDCEDSRVVAMGLLAMGHSNVSVYRGGWEEWSASGSPVEK